MKGRAVKRVSLTALSRRVFVHSITSGTLGPASLYLGRVRWLAPSRLCRPLFTVLQRERSVPDHWRLLY